MDKEIMKQRKNHIRKTIRDFISENLQNEKLIQPIKESSVMNKLVDEQRYSDMNYNNIVIDFFTGMRGIDDLFESIYEGLYGGVQRYRVEPNEGNFDKDFLIKFIKINQGDNDFDYELGRIGYRFLTSDEGLKELSKFYLDELKTYKDEYVSNEVIENCKKSLINIMNS